MAEALCMNQASTATSRRLLREWELLKDLVQLNPCRLFSPRAVDCTFFVTLRQTPALPLDPAANDFVEEHTLRLEFPGFFPTLPLELYLKAPVRHPNIHPVTGFVCLWQSHRVEYTVEHALHRTVAILGWQLVNLDNQHVMQPDCLTEIKSDLASRLVASRRQVQPLRGVDHAAAILQVPGTPRRVRLS